MNTTCLSETIMVEVFKTNVEDKLLANALVEQIHASFDLISVNFDLEDCDKILRVEGVCIDTAWIIGYLEKKGLDCALL